MGLIYCVYVAMCVVELLAWAWASPTLAWLHCKTCVCLSVCLFVCYHIPKIWIERTEMKVHKFAHVLKFFNLSSVMSVRWIYWYRLNTRRTPHRVTQRWWIYWVRETDCFWSETAAPVPKRTGRKAERTKVRQTRTLCEVCRFSRSIGMELDSEGSIELLLK